jgi:predicted RNase H-like HicB family nuclease
VKTGRLTILGEQNVFQLHEHGETTKAANERAEQLINKNHNVIEEQDQVQP